MERVCILVPVLLYAKYGDNERMKGITACHPNLPDSVTPKVSLSQHSFLYITPK